MIAYVRTSGSAVTMVDENGRSLGSFSTGANNKFIGNTSSTITMKNGSYIDVYDEKGRKVDSWIDPNDGEQRRAERAQYGQEEGFGGFWGFVKTVLLLAVIIFLSIFFFGR